MKKGLPGFCKSVKCKYVDDFTLHIIGTNLCVRENGIPKNGYVVFSPKMGISGNGKN